ncbi:MAG: hypothetical protein HOU81_07290 [Hamadaea sp.]|uniref:hypothetical protein n=1 Tax=Hamadaea sp. TaxID=2024425 RepID=UPI0017BD39F7|nr:hypothetical protein [Hamadaea sp.]NUR70608.1 hypothetical protein [Hamadaea sp.]NUT22346.1 hypothetical protein [Hamadaea sp.]
MSSATLTPSSTARVRRSLPGGLRGALTPLFPPATEYRRSWRAIALAVVTIVAGAGLSMTRNGGAGAWNTIWAEDGTNFLTDALNESVLRTVFKPINGYFLVLPRLLTELTTLFPIEWAAGVMSATAASVGAFLAVLVYTAAGAHVRSWIVRGLVAAPLIVAPVGQGASGPNGGSVINNLATLQFLLVYAVFWLVLWTPASRTGRIVASAVIALTAFSTPLSIVVIPLAAARLLVRRDLLGWSNLAGLVAGAALQFGALGLGLTSRSAIGHTRMDPFWILGEYAQWLVPNAVLGEAWNHSGEVVIVVAAWVVVAAGIALALTKVTSPRLLLSAVALVVSIGLTAFQIGTLGAVADRYLYTPGLLVIAALALLLEPRRPTVAALAPAVGLAFLLGVVCLANWQADNHRSHAYSWQSVVAQARDKCAVGEPKRVTVRTNPALSWRVVFPCRVLR